MDKLTWRKLADVHGRMEAELIKSYLNAHGIDVELFQEAIGHHIYPTTIDGTGLTQIFVPKEKFKDARELYEEFKRT